jgi:diguanylate cyclase (GGDEF)-like protein
MSSLCLVGSLVAVAVLCVVLFLARWCGSLAARIEALARVSTLDPLTGLPNGRLFESERWPAAIRDRAPLCLLYIDLDHLKENNDRFGRRIGDRYIVRAAALLRQACRRGIDPVFRLHTACDEFVVLLYGNDAFHGETVARHILCFLLREHISASIGIASTRSTEHSSRAALLEQAEQAMRQAKREGKGRFVVFGPSTVAPASPLEAVPEAIHDSPVLPVRKRS